MLVLRAWVEGGSPRVLRARITQSRDLRGSEQFVLTTASVDEALKAVRDWLDALLEDPGTTS